MAKSKTANTDSTTSPKKPRQRKAQYFLASVTGDDHPTVIVAKSRKDALNAIVSLKSATAADLMDAGKNNFPVIDTTVPTADKSSGE